MVDDDRFRHHIYLQRVVDEDVRLVQEKDVSYGASWKRRGGVGVFMMLARKWDRLEELLQPSPRVSDRPHYDIFAGIMVDLSGADGTVLAEVRDLRRYLLLVEAEISARKASSDTTIGTLSVDVEINVKPYAGEQFQNIPCDNFQYGPECSWLCATCGRHIRVHKFIVTAPRPVPAEDSNRHAPRARPAPGRDSGVQEALDRRALLETGQPRPCVSAGLYHTLSEPLRDRYVLAGKVALIDRAQLSDSDREPLARYPQTMTDRELRMLPDWVPGLYEPRDGVPGEVQLKSQFRLHWGR